MSQLEAAVSGACITEPTLKRSKKGTAYLRVLLGADEGNARQFIWVCCFGEVAERAAGQLKKGGKLYAEGQLTAEIYERDGKPTAWLHIAARRGEVLNLIGKQRPKENRPTQDAPSHRSPRAQRDGFSFDNARDDAKNRGWA